MIALYNSGIQIIFFLLLTICLHSKVINAQQLPIPLAVDANFFDSPEAFIINQNDLVESDIHPDVSSIHSVSQAYGIINDDDASIDTVTAKFPLTVANLQEYNERKQKSKILRHNGYPGRPLPNDAKLTDEQRKERNSINLVTNWLNHSKTAKFHQTLVLKAFNSNNNNNNNNNNNTHSVLVEPLYHQYISPIVKKIKVSNKKKKITVADVKDYNRTKFIHIRKKWEKNVKKLKRKWEKRHQLPFYPSQSEVEVLKMQLRKHRKNHDKSQKRQHVSYYPRKKYEKGKKHKHVSYNPPADNDHSKQPSHNPDWKNDLLYPEESYWHFIARDTSFEFNHRHPLSRQRRNNNKSNRKRKKSSRKMKPEA